MYDWLWTEQNIKSIIRSIVKYELRKLRPASTLKLASADIDEILVGASKAHETTSLERFHLATQVAVFFELISTEMAEDLLHQPSIDNWCQIAYESRRMNDDGISFQTSGSTGQAKVQRHRLTTIIEEAQQWQRLLDAPTQFRGNVPRHHIFGFIFTIALPSLYRANYEDCADQLPLGMFTNTESATTVITYPEALQLFISSGQQASPHIRVLSSTAPCSPEISKQLLAAGVCNHLHIYGSTETSGVGYRENTNTQLKLLPGLTKTDDNQVIRADGTGAILPLQDKLEFTDAKHFLLAGRKDNMVQIGGYNTSLEWITAKINAHPEVAEAAVRTFDSPVGMRLKAFIVPRDNLALKTSSNNIETFLRSHLPAHEQPSTITFGESLPRNDLGKLADW